MLSLFAKKHTEIQHLPLFVSRNLNKHFKFVCFLVAKYDCAFTRVTV